MLKYGFEENVDYIVFTEFGEKGGRPKKEYVLKIDMAKEIAMIQRNEKGKQVRRYFIECERKLKEIVPMISKKEQLLLQLFSNNPAEVANAHKQITEMEVKEATKPLLKTIDEKVKLAIMKNITSSHGGLRANTEMWFLTEDGLYEVLMQSRKSIISSERCCRVDRI